jgi:hypothetical protein
MVKKLIVIGICLLSAVPLFARDPGLLTYDQFLNSRGLTRGDVDCINSQTEAVLNPRTQGWDPNKAVCEVWIKEKRTPAERLTFKDGSQVYMTPREWQETIPRTETTTKSDDFVVKQDAVTEASRKQFKRYVTTDNQ